LCREPLARRINSANVPADFKATDPATDPAVIKRAEQLSDQLQNSPQQRQASTKVAEKLETEFNQQVDYFGDLRTKYGEAQKLIAKLQKECEMLRPSPAGDIHHA
jgi:hypothetical protein